jgi:hypothetical protein
MTDLKFKSALKADLSRAANHTQVAMLSGATTQPQRRSSSNPIVIAMTKTRKRRPNNLLTNVLGELGKLAERRPVPILPADVVKHLLKAMLAHENVLEDARYLKVVPNDYRVELNEVNYNRHYQPVEKLVCEQWQERLLEALNIANSRQGRKEYRFGGRVHIRLQPTTTLDVDEVRIHCQINAEVDVSAGGAISACLELLPDGRQWSLRKEMTVIGRDESCEVYLDLPLIQQTRLVSGQHAYIRQEGDGFYLYDGSPEGKASVNGTFANGQRLSPLGHLLQEGDVIILAALDPQQPRIDTPGVAAFRFRAGCG